MKEYYQRNKQEIKEYQQRPEVKAKAKEYSQIPEVKAKRKEYRKEKYGSDIDFKLKTILRSRLNLALRRYLRSMSNKKYPDNKQKADAEYKKLAKKRPKFESATKLIGCSIPKLMEHLEKQFKPGMSWDNWSPKG
mgnify:CR=1 FL=1|tara:strand:+ start:1778 stop:2182 length:405 start_codon:yes stop_codon:yes gene_type:complete